MRSRVVAFLREVLVCAALWVVLGGLAFLVLRSLHGDEPGDLHGPVRALDLGVQAFVAAVAALAGAWVCGANLVDARVPRGGWSILLTWAVPVVVIVAERVLATRWTGRDQSEDLAFLAAAVAGGLTGAVLSVVRSRDDEESHSVPARRRDRHGRVGWGSR